ncbi:MAG: DNA gyrase inhibitor YacG [Betaproteobacteria bacterium]|nr:DNA gyrase inhibitor YacG [Betaproteobacteria bacterium]
MQSVRKVPCPRCGRRAPFSAENQWRPFCSERCRLIDLGLWASEGYRVPSEEPPDPAQDPSPKPPES